MTWRHWLELIGALLLLAVIGAYIGSRVDAARMDATIAAQKEVIATAQKSINDAQADRLQHQKDDAARDAQTANQLAEMARTVAMLKTPQQQVDWSQSQLANEIHGIKVTLDAKGNAIATIPAASVPDLPRVLENCKESSVKLDKCQTDLTSRMTQQADADKVIEQLKVQKGGLEKDLDAAKTAAKGGNFVQRAKKRVEHFAVDGGILLVLLCGTGHCKF